MSDDPRLVMPAGQENSTRHYRIVFAADLKFSAGAALRDVDVETIDALLAEVKPRLPLAIPAPGGGADWELEVTLGARADLAPAALLRQAPQARARLEARSALLERRGGRSTPEALERALAAHSATDSSLAWLRTKPGAAAAASGGSILDLVDDPQSSVAADVQRLAQSFSEPSALGGAEALHVDGLLARLNAELTQAANAVLKHASFRALESAWRGLFFVLSQSDHRAGMRVSVLDAPRDTLVERLYDLVLTPAFDGQAPTPNLVVLDHAFANRPPDIELLGELAQHAAGLPVPVVFPIDAAFFNVKSLRLIKNLPNLSALVDGWEFAKWRALRDQPHSRVLFPVIGRLLLRAPHEGRADGAFSPAESAASAGDLLWGGGHLAMAVCAARAFARHGWPTRMFGAEAGRVDGLPVVPNPNEPGGVWGPGDLQLPDRRLDEPPQIGMNPLVAIPNSDGCMLLGGVSVRRPVVTQEVGAHDAALEVSLPYQQVANILSAHLFEVAPQLHGLGEAEVQQRLLGSLAALLGIGLDDAESIQVGVGTSPDAPGQTVVQVRIVPPARIAPGGLVMTFGLAV